MASEKLALSPIEVSQLCGLSLNSVYSFIREGRIPSTKMGRRILIPRKELEAVLASGVPDKPVGG